MPKQPRPKSRKEITKALSDEIENICNKYNEMYDLEDDFALLFFVSIKGEGDMRSVSFTTCGKEDVIVSSLKSLMDNSADNALLFTKATAEYAISQARTRRKLEIELSN